MLQYNNNNNHDGRNYNTWTSNRGSTNQRLDKFPAITTLENGVRYYSAIDANFYFGDIYIGEITNIVYTVQQQALPLFGYNSYTFDDIAVGSRLVQGQFAINFIERNYIEHIQNSEGFKRIARRSYGIDKKVTSIYSDYRKELHLPKWDSGFDIVIGLGDQKSTSFSTYLVINCVQVTSSSIQLDVNGKPVQEIYTFIGKDIKEAYSDGSQISSENSSKTETIQKESSQMEDKISCTMNLTRQSYNLYLTFEKDSKFISGNIKLNGNFKNKILNSQMEMTSISGGVNLACTLSQNFIDAWNKECSDINDLTCTAKIKYETIDKEVRETTTNIKVDVIK